MPLKKRLTPDNPKMESPRNTKAQNDDLDAIRNGERKNAKSTRSRQSYPRSHKAPISEEIMRAISFSSNAPGKKGEMSKKTSLTSRKSNHDPHDTTKQIRKITRQFEAASGNAKSSVKTIATKAKENLTFERETKTNFLPIDYVPERTNDEKDNTIPGRIR